MLYLEEKIKLNYGYVYLAVLIFDRSHWWKGIHNVLLQVYLSGGRR